MSSNAPIVAGDGRCMDVVNRQNAIYRQDAKGMAGNMPLIKNGVQLRSWKCVLRKNHSPANPEDYSVEEMMPSNWKMSNAPNWISVFCVMQCMNSVADCKNAQSILFQAIPTNHVSMTGLMNEQAPPKLELDPSDKPDGN